MYLVLLQSDYPSLLLRGYAADVRDAVTLFFFMQFVVRLWLAPWAPGALPACIGEIADGIGSPDPNPRNLVNWCF